MKKTTLIISMILLSMMVFVAVVSIFTLFPQSIRLDESQSEWQAIKPLGFLISFEAADVQTPLYYIIIHFWLQFFGTNVIYLRLLSLIFLLATIPILYLLYKESSNRRIGLIATLFFSLSPFIVWYGSEARTYTLFILITTLNHLFFLRLMRSEGKTNKLSFFISSVLGFYTHYFFSFFIFSQALYVLYQFIINLYKKKRFRRISLLKRIWIHREPALTYFILIGLAILTFIPWVFYFLELGAGKGTEPRLLKPTEYNIFQTFSNFVFGFQSQGIESILISFWPLVVVGVFFLFTRRNKSPIKDLFYFVFITFFPVIFVFWLSSIKAIYLSRYLIFITPSLFFILAWVLVHYPKRLSSLAIVGFSLLMAVLLFYQNISVLTPVKEDYRGVDAYLEKNAGSQDIIAVIAPFTILPIEYAYQGNVRIETIPNWQWYLVRYQPQFTISSFQQQLKVYTMNYRNIFIILSYDQGNNKAVANYMDKHFLREKIITFSPGLQLREYKLEY